MAGPAKVAQRQVVARITPNDGVSPNFITSRKYFAQVSGGEITSAPEKVYDGGASQPDVLCAPAEIGDITLVRHLSVEDEDLDKLKQLRPRVGTARYNIDVFVLNCDLMVPGTDRVYADALLVGITEPEGDSSSAGPATYALTFAVGAVA